MREWFARFGDTSKGGVRLPIATKLILSFLLIIAVVSSVFIIVGIRLIGDRIVAEAQDEVRHDLNIAREIYLGKLRDINSIIRFTADRFFLKTALMSGNVELVAEELSKIQLREGLDVLTIIDETGKVFLRINNQGFDGDDQGGDELVSAVLSRKVPLSATSVMSADDLRKESETLAEKANITFVDTPLARETEDTEITDGLMLRSAAPIFDYENRCIGVLHAGVLLNRNFEIVDKIKQTIFEDQKYDGKEIGTATILLDDVRISTNVRNEDGSRALGTRVSKEVFNWVVDEGQAWIDRAYVVNDWYIAAYEPIRNLNNQIVGILYVGVLEQKYVDLQRQTVLAFLAITLLGTLAAMTLAYLLSRRISIPIRELASASREIEQGNLDAHVKSITSDELGDLADTFNAMASALKQRDKELMEFTTSKIMESEKLALIGQLAANVAHELNNPLQGIVTYSYLLLEKMPNENSATELLNKIVIQANRCRDIIRALLDLSRQRKPDKTICDINSVLDECVVLIENQALFHNIEITKQFDGDIPKVVVDPSQMQQVFMNMIINAAEAMEDGGRLDLTTRFDPVEEQFEIEITDTGQGISEENVDKLFDPFFTTKDVGHGTGLGLAISYGIIKEHKGTISVETEEGKGTTFLIRLPMKAVEEGSDGRS